MFNWLSQIVSVTVFNLRTIPDRKGAALAAAVGIAGVVAVFVGFLSIAEGFRAAMTVSGADDVVIVLRSGADNEMTSSLSREEARLIADGPGLARAADGPLASAELFVIINLPKRSTGTDANVPFRGVERAALSVRDDFKIVNGRRFELGRNEVIVGVGAARSFAGLDVEKNSKSARMNGKWSAFSRAGAARRNPKSGPTPPCCSRLTTAGNPSSQCVQSSRHLQPSSSSRMHSPRIRNSK